MPTHTPEPTANDPLLVQATQLILLNRDPSISLLQRHLKIGYTRAKAIMEALVGSVVEPRPTGAGWQLIHARDLGDDAHRALFLNQTTSSDEADAQEPPIYNVMFGIGRRQRYAEFSDLLQDEGAVLYYPGSGDDYGPMLHLYQQFKWSAVFYVDYLSKRNDALKMVRDMPGTQSTDIQPLGPRFMRQRAWNRYWHTNPASQRFAVSRSAFAFACDLSIEDAATFRYHFYRTDAVQTYENLLNTGVKPTVVVLQDHGWGCNWTSFGGSHEMYETALLHRALPEFLFVADNTIVWPGYVRIDAPVVIEGQMHRHARALYRRNPAVSWRDLLDSHSRQY